jgi:hypothetical protein
LAKEMWKYFKDLWSSHGARMKVIGERRNLRQVIVVGYY